MPPTYMETIGFYRDAARHVATNAGVPARSARGLSGVGRQLAACPYRTAPTKSAVAKLADG